MDTILESREVQVERKHFFIEFPRTTVVAFSGLPRKHTAAATR